MTGLAIETQGQGGHVGLAVTLAAVGAGTIIDHGLEQLPATVTAAAAFAGAIAALLPALSSYLDRRQARRHAEERYLKNSGITAGTPRGRLDTDVSRNEVG
jgi:hypothetical protein